MLTLNNRTMSHLVDRLVPRVAERLAVRPRPGDLVGGLEDLLNEIEAAAILGMRPSTLCAWRHRGRGPSYLRIGHGIKPAVKYRRRVILAFRDARESNPER